MPVAVFVVGCVFSTERFSWGTFGNMIIVSIGVAIASFGEQRLPIVVDWAFEVPRVLQLAAHLCHGINCRHGTLVQLRLCQLCLLALQAS